MVDLAFGPDGTLYCGDDAGVLRAVDLADGRARVLARGGGRIWAVAVSSRGRVAWGDDQGDLRELAPEARGARTLAEGGDGVLDLAYSRGGQLAAGFRSGAVRLVPGAAVGELEADALGVSWAPDGRRLAGVSYAGEGAIWDVSDGRRVRRLRYETGDVGADMNGVLWLGPDTVAVASQDGTVRFFSVRTGRVVGRLPRRSGWSRGLARAGDVLADTGADGTVRLSDLGSRRELASIPVADAELWDVAISPDRRYAVACGGDGKLHAVGVA